MTLNKYLILSIICLVAILSGCEKTNPDFEVAYENCLVGIQENQRHIANRKADKFCRCYGKEITDAKKELINMNNAQQDAFLSRKTAFCNIQKDKM